jgi:hypothetical protein
MAFTAIIMPTMVAEYMKIVSTVDIQSLCPFALEVLFW